MRLRRNGYQVGCVLRPPQEVFPVEETGAGFPASDTLSRAGLPDS